MSGLAATTASFVVVRGDVDRINQERIDRNATDALLSVQHLTAAVDQVLATANGAVATSDADPKQFVAVLGPDVRSNPTLAGMALVTNARSRPRVRHSRLRSRLNRSDRLPNWNRRSRPIRSIIKRASTSRWP